MNAIWNIEESYWNITYISQVDRWFSCPLVQLSPVQLSLGSVWVVQLRCPWFTWPWFTCPGTTSPIPMQSDKFISNSSFSWIQAMINRKHPSRETCLQPLNQPHEDTPMHCSRMGKEPSVSYNLYTVKVNSRHYSRLMGLDWLFVSKNHVSIHDTIP